MKDYDATIRPAAVGDPQRIENASLRARLLASCQIGNFAAVKDHVWC